MATTHVGAVQLKKETVLPWSAPVFDAFVAGGWLLYWTPDTLYWCAKPRVHVEHIDGRRRLHNESGPALECHIENLYFWHGIMVPAYVVTHPQWITVDEIERENNAEVRRVLVERYGRDRYLRDSGATLVNEDNKGKDGTARKLWRKEQQGDEPIVTVELVNSTAEPDGTFKRYMIGVPPDTRTCADALAWMHYETVQTQYNPEVET